MDGGCGRDSHHLAQEERRRHDLRMRPGQDLSRHSTAWRSPSGDHVTRWVCDIRVPCPVKDRFTLRSLGPRRTRFTWREQLEFPWWLGGSVGGVVGAEVLRLIWKRNLRNLKRVVEEPRRRRVRTAGPPSTGSRHWSAAQIDPAKNNADIAMLASTAGTTDFVTRSEVEHQHTGEPRRRSARPRDRPSRCQGPGT